MNILKSSHIQFYKYELQKVLQMNLKDNIDSRIKFCRLNSIERTAQHYTLQLNIF